MGVWFFGEYVGRFRKYCGSTRKSNDPKHVLYETAYPSSIQSRTIISVSPSLTFAASSRTLFLSSSSVLLRLIITRPGASVFDCEHFPGLVAKRICIITMWSFGISCRICIVVFAYKAHPQHMVYSPEVWTFMMHLTSTGPFLEMSPNMFQPPSPGPRSIIRSMRAVEFLVAEGADCSKRRWMSAEMRSGVINPGFIISRIESQITSGIAELASKIIPIVVRSHCLGLVQSLPRRVQTRCTRFRRATTRFIAVTAPTETGSRA